MGESADANCAKSQELDASSQIDSPFLEKKHVLIKPSAKLKRIF
jgi:hypothetical protein